MPGLTRSNTDYEDEDLSQYEAYLASSSIPTRASVILTGTAALLLTASFFGSAFYFLHTGKRVYDPDGTDNTTALLIFLGFGAATFAGVFLHVLFKYRNTYGTTALLSEAEGQWREETESIASIHKPKRFPVLINLLLTIVAAGVFISTLLATLQGASTGKPDQDGQEPENKWFEMLTWLILSFGFSIFFAQLTKKSYLRYLYNQQFSQEPLVRGVYYGNGNSVDH
ncbi:hypothetical protein D0Z00_002174 [Geotrichum galactomycetum]|uniref:Uncharacterized protein n=1 Tax=Geotrichum galactomycetum TaxID=27317 RepID=A0ACB6V4Y4_9ASCO|nr:hypothetical protein D0Z00_002174 [Geotrichum candidum]